MNNISHSEKFFKLLDAVTDSLSNSEVLSAWSCGVDISGLENAQELISEISGKVNQDIVAKNSIAPVEANQLILFSELMSALYKRSLM